MHTMSSKNVIMQGGGGVSTPNSSRPTDLIRPDSIMGGVSEVTNPPTPVEASNEGERLRSKKLVNVTVTILSIAGLFVKDGVAKKKGGLMSKTFSSRSNNSNNNNNSSPPRNIKSADENGTEADSTLTGGSSPSKETSSSNSPPTTIVASFSRMVKTKEEKPKTVMTHVPSMPLPLADNNNGSGSSGSPKKKTLNSVIHWPEQQQLEDANAASSSGDNNGLLGTHGRGRVLSSYQFQRTFQQEETAASESSNPPSDRFVPQPLPIQIAISRCGRMFKLGTASVLLSGEENGESSINVQIKNCNPAIPKSNKFKVLSNKEKEKMIPMMKLKGDTLKCGLDPNATLRVLVHVSEPIGETLEISPKFNVTMITNTAEKPSQPRLQPRPREYQKQPLQGQENEAAAAASNKGVPSDISWEYNPSLAAVVVKIPVCNDQEEVDNEEAGDDNGPLLRVLTHQETDQGEDHEDYPTEDDDEDCTEDEPSCSSSAYMSAVVDRYPSKISTNGYSVARSYSTGSTTTTDISSVVSDLTDGQSWLSQTGIEVIPFAPHAILDQVNLPPHTRLRHMLDQVSLPSNSRLHDLFSEDESSTAADSRTTARSTLGQTSTITSSPTRISNMVATTPAKKSWRQRLACGGIPGCYNYDYDHDALPAVSEEDVVSTNRYSLVGRCEAAGDYFHQPSTSYYTEGGDVSFVEDDDDDSSESSSESSA